MIHTSFASSVFMFSQCVGSLFVTCCILTSKLLQKGPAQTCV